MKVREFTESGGERETLVERLRTDSDSPFRKYRDLYVGGGSFLDFVWYELLTSLLSPIPGAAGFFLRRVFYTRILGKVGRGTALGSFLALRSPGNVFLGPNVFVDSHAVLDAKGPESSIRIGDSVLIGGGTILSCASGTIAIGDDVSVGPYCYIRAGLSSIRIGSSVTIGAHSSVVSGNPSYKRLDIPMKSQVGSCEGIVIGDDVWIGVGARVVDGVNIRNGSVVGAGAVVVEDVPEFAIVAGVPARIIGSRLTED